MDGGKGDRDSRRVIPESSSSGGQNIHGNAERIPWQDVKPIIVTEKEFKDIFGDSSDEEPDFYGFTDKELGLKEFRNVMSPNKLKFQDDFYMPLFLSHRKRNRDIALERSTKIHKESTIMASNQFLDSIVESATKRVTNVVPKTQIEPKMVEAENPYAKKYKSFRRDRSRSSNEPQLIGKEVYHGHTGSGKPNIRDIVPKMPVSYDDSNEEDILKKQLSLGSQKDVARRQGDKEEVAIQRIPLKEQLMKEAEKTEMTVIDITNDETVESSSQAKHSSAVSPHSDLKMKIRYQRHVRPKRKVVIPEHQDFVYNFPLPNRKRARTLSPTIITDAKILREQTDDEVVLLDGEEILTNDNAEGIENEEISQDPVTEPSLVTETVESNAMRPNISSEMPVEKELDADICNDLEENKEDSKNRKKKRFKNFRGTRESYPKAVMEDIIPISPNKENICKELCISLDDVSKMSSCFTRSASNEIETETSGTGVSLGDRDGEAKLSREITRKEKPEIVDLTKVKEVPKKQHLHDHRRNSKRVLMKDYNKLNDEGPGTESIKSKDSIDAIIGEIGNFDRNADSSDNTRSEDQSVAGKTDSIVIGLKSGTTKHTDLSTDAENPKDEIVSGNLRTLGRQRDVITRPRKLRSRGVVSAPPQPKDINLSDTWFIVSAPPKRRPKPAVASKPSKDGGSDAKMKTVVSSDKLVSPPPILGKFFPTDKNKRPSLPKRRRLKNVTFPEDESRPSVATFDDLSANEKNEEESMEDRESFPINDPLPKAKTHVLITTEAEQESGASDSENKNIFSRLSHLRSNKEKQSVSLDKKNIEQNAIESNIVSSTPGCNHDDGVAVEKDTELKDDKTKPDNAKNEFELDSVEGTTKSMPQSQQIEDHVLISPSTEPLEHAKPEIELKQDDIPSIQQLSNLDTEQVKDKGLVDIPDLEQKMSDERDSLVMSSKENGSCKSKEQNGSANAVASSLTGKELAGSQQLNEGAQTDNESNLTAKGKEASNSLDQKRSVVPVTFSNPMKMIEGKKCENPYIDDSSDVDVESSDAVTHTDEQEINDRRKIDQLPTTECLLASVAAANEASKREASNALLEAGNESNSTGNDPQKPVDEFVKTGIKDGDLDGAVDGPTKGIPANERKGNRRFTKTDDKTAKKIKSGKSFIIRTAVDESEKQISVKPGQPLKRRTSKDFDTEDSEVDIDITGDPLNSNTGQVEAGSSEQKKVKRKIFTVVRKIRRTEINAEGKKVTKIIKQIVKKVLPANADPLAETDTNRKGKEIGNVLKKDDDPTKLKKDVMTKTDSSKVSRCGKCVRCNRIEDCEKCNNCRKKRESVTGKVNLICRLRQCLKTQRKKNESSASNDAPKESKEPTKSKTPDPSRQEISLKSLLFKKASSLKKDSLQTSDAEKLAHETVKTAKPKAKTSKNVKNIEKDLEDLVYSPGFKLRSEKLQQVKRKPNRILKEVQYSGMQPTVKLPWPEELDEQSICDSGNFFCVTSPIAVAAKDICFHCGSGGFSKMITCINCSEAYHEFCIEIDPLDENKWFCDRCKRCNVCGYKDNLLMCDKCHDCYHAECLGPNYHKQTEGSDDLWVCAKCVKCEKCGAKTPGMRKESKWMDNFSLCEECDRRMRRGQFCCICRNVYSENDYDTKMMFCSKCSKWIHMECEGLSPDEYECLAELPEEIPYVCKICHGSEVWPKWYQEVREEMQAGFEKVYYETIASSDYKIINKHMPGFKNSAARFVLDDIFSKIQGHKFRTVVEFQAALKGFTDEVSSLISGSLPDQIITDLEVLVKKHVGAMFPWTKTTKAKSKKTTDVNVAKPKEGIAFPASALHAIALDHAYHKETEEKNQESSKENETAQTKELDACDDPDDNIFDKLLCREQSLLDIDEQGIDDPKRKVSTVSEEPVETLNREAKKKEIVDDCGRSCPVSISNEQPLFERLLCREKSLLDLNEQNSDVPRIEVSTVKEKSLETLSNGPEKKENNGPSKKSVDVLDDSQSCSLSEQAESIDVEGDVLDISKNGIDGDSSHDDDAASILGTIRTAKHNDDRRCLLCNQYGDEDEKDAGRILNAGLNEWVHVNCALWSAEVYENDAGLLQNVHAAISRGQKLRCSLCQQWGATVGCCAAGCPSNYHFMCGRNSSVIFQDNKLVYCRRHEKKSKHEVILNDEGFIVERPVMVDLSKVTGLKKYSQHQDPDSIHLYSGSLVVHRLGRLNESSNGEEVLIPIGFRATKLFWSAKDTRKRCRYYFSIEEKQISKPLKEKEVAEDIFLGGVTTCHDEISGKRKSKESDNEIITNSQKRRKTDESCQQIDLTSSCPIRPKQGTAPMTHSVALEETSFPNRPLKIGKDPFDVPKSLGEVSVRNSNSRYETALSKTERSTETSMQKPVVSTSEHRTVQNHVQNLSFLDSRTTLRTSQQKTFPCKISPVKTSPHKIIPQPNSQLDRVSMNYHGEAMSRAIDQSYGIQRVPNHHEKTGKPRLIQPKLRYELVPTILQPDTTGSSVKPILPKCETPIVAIAQHLQYHLMANPQMLSYIGNTTLQGLNQVLGLAYPTVVSPGSCYSTVDASVLPCYTLNLPDTFWNSYAVQKQAEDARSLRSPFQVQRGACSSSKKSKGDASCQTEGSASDSYRLTDSQRTDTIEKLRTLVNERTRQGTKFAESQDLGPNRGLFSRDAQGTEARHITVSNNPRTAMQANNGTGCHSARTTSQINYGVFCNDPRPNLQANHGLSDPRISLQAYHAAVDGSSRTCDTSAVNFQNDLQNYCRWLSSELAKGNKGASEAMLHGSKIGMSDKATNRHSSQPSSNDLNPPCSHSMNSFHMSESLPAIGNLVDRLPQISASNIKNVASGYSTDNGSSLNDSPLALDQVSEVSCLQAAAQLAEMMPELFKDQQFVNMGTLAKDARSTMAEPLAFGGQDTMEKASAGDIHPALKTDSMKTDNSFNDNRSESKRNRKWYQKRMKKLLGNETPNCISALRIMLKNEEGLQIEGDTPQGVWKQLVDQLNDSRLDQKLPPLIFSENEAFDFFGLSKFPVLFLAEQLPGGQKCRDYKFQFHLPCIVDEDKELPVNPHGCARAECHHRKASHDMFAWLASPYRTLPQYPDEPECDNEINKTSSDLPLSMRFRQLKNSVKDHVGVYRSPIDGRGLFCKRQIEAGEMVIEYAGSVIRATLTDKRENYYEGKGYGCYMFRIDDTFVVDATLFGNEARFINHSCEPNCYSRIVPVDGEKHIVIFASRRIFPGEELTYDYKFPFEEEKLPCHCGSKKCRKYLN